MATQQRKKPAAKKPAAKSKTAPRNAVSSVLDGHQSDMAGIGAILLGLLTAVSLWFGSAGVVGEALDDGLALCLGLTREVVPFALLTIGVLLVKGSGGEEGAAEGRGSDRLARVLVGGLLAIISITGLFHIGRGRPGIDDSITEIGAAGGALGMAIGGPLYAFAAAAGSVLILGAIGIVGLLVVTGWSVRTVGYYAGVALKPIPGLFVRGLRSLFADPTGPAEAIDHDPPEPESVPAPAPPPEPVPAPKVAKHRAKVVEPAVEAAVEAEQQPLLVNTGKWKLPAASMLARSEARAVNRAEVDERGRLLRYTLDQFGVATTLLEPVVGPTVTRYVLELGEGVKVAKLESLRKDIAYAMASPDVRILAPIPGRRAIGVEVPNLERQIIALGDILSSQEARHAKHPLEVAVGRDINGRNVLINLATMPHVLIAGATGAGKSSCLNSLLTSILMRSTPEQVRLILIDPKRVEMGQYERTPHLLTAPVTDPRQAANALAWAVREMERRYDLLHKVGFRDITGYNNAVDAGSIEVGLGEVGPDGEPLEYQRLAFMLIVVDELADLMMVAARDVEDSIARIAQMARAVGIHLVIATQRPSVNVITGVIKANVPARLAFAVSSLTDSRVILDQPGAERLVGKGDLLLLGPSSSTAHRIQGCWVEEDEVRAIVKHWKDQAPDYPTDESVAAEAVPGVAVPGVADSLSPPPADDGGDEFLGQAMELVVQTQLGSTSMLQRKLRVGFARAGRIMDLLEEAGVVGPSTGSKARDVLISPEELAARRGDS